MFLSLIIWTVQSSHHDDGFFLRRSTLSDGGGMNMNNKNLQMRSGKPFKIGLFADLHFGENAWTDWGPLQDMNSIEVMSTVLDLEKPGMFLPSISYRYSYNFIGSCACVDSSSV